MFKRERSIEELGQLVNKIFREEGCEICSSSLRKALWCSHLSRASTMITRGGYGYDREWIRFMRYDSIYSWRVRCPEVHVHTAVATCGIARGCNTPNSLAIDWMTVAGSLEEPRWRNAKVARRSSAAESQLSCELVLICPTQHRHAPRTQLDKYLLTSQQ